MKNWPRITSLLPKSLDSHRFAYQAKTSREESVSTAPHAESSHVEQQGDYLRMLSVDDSSAFTTILPQKLVNKLGDLGIEGAESLAVLSTRMTAPLLTTATQCSKESGIIHCLCVQFASCTAAQNKVLKKVINAALKIVGSPSPRWTSGTVLAASQERRTL